MADHENIIVVSRYRSNKIGQESFPEINVKFWTRILILI